MTGCIETESKSLSKSLVFERLETDRTFMRPFEDDDLVDLSVIFSDPQVMLYTATGRPKTPSMSANYLHCQQDHQEIYGFSLGAVIRRSDQRLIGQCGLARLHQTQETVLGYTFAQDCWGYGYATETTIAWLKFAFDQLQLPKIMAAVKSDNRASLRVLDKLGMSYDRTDTFYGCACAYYGIRRDQWKASKIGSAV
jgi:[ribosomal protein S5]-alanine N-acetyltransferase